MQSNSTQRIIVGLSGGVDSAVAALLLQQQGYEVQGLFMKNWEEDDTPEYCSAAADLADAEQVCQRLDIPLHTVNFAAEYWDRVFSHFLAEYRAGRTPNPDVLCNKEIKFKAFLDHARDLGAQRIATGHYARVRRDNAAYTLLKATDTNKDQSYFLHTLDQAQLAHAVFPLGGSTKPEIRCLAEQAGFANHAKKDSTGICFIGERKFRDFLQRYLPAQPGDIYTPEGECVGRHQGLMYYTLGQRQGLGIGGRRSGADAPWYVVDKDLAGNRLIVAQGHEHPRLLRRQVSALQLHWISGAAPPLPYACYAKTRYRQADQACTLYAIDQDRAYIRFAAPQRALTPGQSIVFYQGERCLGGGVMTLEESAPGE